MLPRWALRHPHCRAISSAAARFARPSVAHSSPQGDDSSVSSFKALDRQQLEFCCLLCGWDVACKTCPFNWYDFDPRKFRGQRRRRKDDDMSKFQVSADEIHQAMETLGLTTSMDEMEHVTITQQQVKAAFREKALEWHPDCNDDPKAEDIFKDIILAYELLLAHAK